MKASGNGTPQTCAGNLLKIVRGENPYERVKGLDPGMIDKPIETVAPDVQQDAEWLLETYEPRVTVRGIRIEQDAGHLGAFTVTADVKENE